MTVLKTAVKQGPPSSDENEQPLPTMADVLGAERDVYQPRSRFWRAADWLRRRVWWPIERRARWVPWRLGFPDGWRCYAVPMDNSPYCPTHVDLRNSPGSEPFESIECHGCMTELRKQDGVTTCPQCGAEAKDVRQMPHIDEDYLIHRELLMALKGHVVQAVFDGLTNDPIRPKVGERLGILTLGRGKSKREALAVLKVSDLEVERGPPLEEG